MNKKELQSQVSRIKKTIAKILDSDTSLTEKLRTLFREQGITLAAIFTAIGIIISTMVVLLTGGGGSGEGAPTNNKKKLISWFKDKLKCLSDALKRLAEKAVAALPGIIGSVFAAVLNFLTKTDGFVFVVGAVATSIYTQTTQSLAWDSKFYWEKDQSHLLRHMICTKISTSILS